MSDLLIFLAAASAVACLVVSLLVLRVVVLASGREDRAADELAVIERALSDRLGGMRLGMEERLGVLTTTIAREQGEARVAMGQGLRQLQEQSAARLAEIQRSVNEQLHASVERQMKTSFQRVLEQFAAVQKAMGEVASMTAQIGDLKRLFSNVKTRGGWGESQLRAILDDVLPPGAYESNVKLDTGSAELVEFAVRMPVRGASRPLLAIDSKFPTEAYERLLDAVDRVDPEAERAARRTLESAVRLEARKIAAKYILPPATVEFAVLYLPTDGLYAEIARMPGLVDEIGRTARVLVMGPGLIPALLRTIHLGYVTLALEEKTEAISGLLGATRQEMIRMDAVLERLGRNASTMSNTIEEARRRTRVVARKLRGIEMPDMAGQDGAAQDGAAQDGAGQGGAGQDGVDQAGLDLGRLDMDTPESGGFHRGASDAAGSDSGGIDAQIEDAAFLDGAASFGAGTVDRPSDGDGGRAWRGPPVRPGVMQATRRPAP